MKILNNRHRDEAIKPHLYFYVEEFNMAKEINPNANKGKKKNFVTIEERDKALKVDLVEFMQQTGLELKRDSDKWYRSVEHDSLVVNRVKNTWSWNSRGIRNHNIIHYAKEFLNLSYPEAVKMINNGMYSENKQIQPSIKTKKPFVYEEEVKEVSDFSKAKNYLVNERKLHPKFIDILHKNGLVAQDNRNNVVFKWWQGGKIVGATLQGTYKNYDKFQKRGTFKQIAENSKENTGWSFTKGQPKNLYIAESPISALSYFELKLGKKQDVHLIEMDGALGKVATALQAMNDDSKELNQAVDSVTLVVDNDLAGYKVLEFFKDRQFAVKGKQIPIYVDIPELTNDWNDVLKDRQSFTTDIQKHPVPIQEWAKENMQLLEKIKENTASKDIDTDKTHYSQKSQAREYPLADGRVDEGSERE